MNPKVNDDFVPLFLYIEDDYENPELDQQIKESEAEDDRGVVIIEVF